MSEGFGTIADYHNKKQVLRCAQDDGQGRIWAGIELRRNSTVWEVGGGSLRKWQKQGMEGIAKGD